ncbi:glycosyl transferase [Pseudomonas sp. 02C 26]|nr:glycosyl transferase [Pseudomonas sp. 02C 26]
MTENASATPIDVTVVLLGHGQLAQRHRTLNFYAQAGVPCVALESLQADAPGQVYKARLQDALTQISSSYVCLALDGDYVLPAALRIAQQCLRSHSSAVAAQGYALAYAAGDSEVAYHRVGSALLAGDEQGAVARLTRYALAGQQAWRAVMPLATLRAALANLPEQLDCAGARVALSYAILAQGEVASLDQTDVVCEYLPCRLTEFAREERLNHTVRLLREWDAAQHALCTDDDGLLLLNHFVRSSYDHADAPLLFTSAWRSVTAEPERRFEPRQDINLPYYNGELFAQLTALEFLTHAWPAGQAQHRALEGTWVRQRELLQVHPNDTAQSLQLRYWQALALGLFNLQVCQRLAATLTGEEDAASALELGEWLARLEQIPGIELQPRLQATGSGAVLAALEAATPPAEQVERVRAHLSKCRPGQIAFVVLDLGNDDDALQATFDSVLASGLRHFKLVVLKAGKAPAITTARDTLHFVEVSESNWAAHLNQVVRQLPSEWLLLLQAGDQLLASGLLHLSVELAEAPACQAICANEVQRDDAGRLHAVLRPGADLNLLRSQPALMSGHWLLRRQAVLDLGGYSESHPHAFELDLLLRLVETQGVGSLAHLNDYLLIARQSSPAFNDDALKALNRHLSQLGYRPQLRNQEAAGLSIDLRHAATPMVSILVAGEGDLAQLQACLASVVQRTRYPRFEVVVACADDGVVAQQSFAGRVRLLVGAPGASRKALLQLAASAARGEYLVLLSARCQVITPAWIEALLNEAQRPEVGVTGGLLQTVDGSLAHAGYALLAGPQVGSPWRGLSAEASVEARWPLAVRNCAAVSDDCVMVHKELFDQSAGELADGGTDIDLCLMATQAGQMVVFTPHAQLMVQAMVVHDADTVRAVAQRWPNAFTAAPAAAQPLEWLTQVS